MSDINRIEQLLYEAQPHHGMGWNRPSEAITVVDIAEDFCNKLRLVASTGRVSVEGAPIIMELSDIENMEKLLQKLKSNSLRAGK